jgi:hypothetical protein
MARKDIPDILPGESDDDYDARLKALGITDEEFDEWFNAEFPESDNEFSHSILSEDVEVADKSKEQANLAGCHKILQMVGNLHSRGYQRLRVFPWSRGLSWVCDLAPADLFDPENGACMESKPEYYSAGLVARILSGNGCRPFGWKRDISRMAIPRIADLFLERHSLIARKSLGSDWAYAGWYQEMLMRTSAELLPLAYYRDEHENEVYRSLRLCAFGEVQEGEMPLPPLYRP